MDVQWNEYNWEPTNARRNHCPPSFSHPAMKEKFCMLPSYTICAIAISWLMKKIYSDANENKKISEEERPVRSVIIPKERAISLSNSPEPS